MKPGVPEMPSSRARARFLSMTACHLGLAMSASSRFASRPTFTAIFKIDFLGHVGVGGEQRLVKDLVLALRLRRERGLSRELRRFAQNGQVLVDHPNSPIFFLEFRDGRSRLLTEAAAVVIELDQGDLAFWIAADR